MQSAESKPGGELEQRAVAFSARSVWDQSVVQHRARVIYSQIFFLRPGTSLTGQRQDALPVYMWAGKWVDGTEGQEKRVKHVDFLEKKNDPEYLISA